MKKAFSLTLIFSSLIYSEVNWEREKVCPLPDPTFVSSLMKTMSIEEKVGQVIQADLDFIKPSDLRDYPIGSVLMVEIPHREVNLEHLLQSGNL